MNIKGGKLAKKHLKEERKAWVINSLGEKMAKMKLENQDCMKEEEQIERLRCIKKQYKQKEEKRN